MTNVCMVVCVIEGTVKLCDLASCILILLFFGGKLKGNQVFSVVSSMFLQTDR